MPIYFKNSLFRLDSAIDAERDNLGIEKGERHYIDLDIPSVDAENSLSGTSLPSLFVSYDSIYRDLYVDLNNDDMVL